MSGVRYQISGKTVKTKDYERKNKYLNTNTNKTSCPGFFPGSFNFYSILLRIFYLKALIKTVIRAYILYVIERFLYGTQRAQAFA